MVNGLVHRQDRGVNRLHQEGSTQVDDQEGFVGWDQPAKHIVDNLVRLAGHSPHADFFQPVQARVEGEKRGSAVYPDIEAGIYSPVTSVSGMAYPLM